MTKHLRRRGLLDDGDDDDGGDDAVEAAASERAGLTRLAASAVSGATPPAGPRVASRCAASHASRDLDPLSLLSRLAASVPPPRFHTVRYAGVLGSASKLRARLAPKPPTATAPCVEDIANVPRPSPYRPWAELLRRTFGLDVLACPRCQGRMRLLATVTEPKSVARYLRALGEPTDGPARAPARGPPYWKSRVLRRAAIGDEAAE